MPRLAYTLLLALLLPLLLLRLWWRGRAFPALRGRLGERLGRVPAQAPGTLWLHCVSVGETMAARPLVDALLARGERVLVTSTTWTGAERVRALWGSRVAHAFLPVDLPPAIAAFLGRVQPRALVVMETELWPNLVHACATRGIPVLLANARLSERSARGYARLGALTRNMLRELVVAAAADTDAQRLRALGATRVEITGNLKFDTRTPADLAAQADALRRGFGARPVWIAASTHAADDVVVLLAHARIRAKRPDALLLLVPRHPERFDEVAAQLVQAGFGCVRRSAGALPSAADAAYLADTMGELEMLYRAADVAFVGGSFSGTGGHNLLEPVAAGLPVLSGPSLFNFAAIADALRGAGLLQVVEDGDALADAVLALLGDAARRRELATQGQAFIAANRGACARTLAILDGMLPARSGRA
jgi:3-deoxy-D-manno-octulosonic-acid transferase